MNDYLKYRGKCKEACLALLEKDPSLKLIRGFYYCPFWGKQQHWWLKDKESNIIDPTCLQFPSKGNGEYEEFNGIVSCETCGKELLEEKAIIEGRYAFCSDLCYGICVGIL